MDSQDSDNIVYSLLVDDDREDQEIFSDALYEADSTSRLSIFDNGRALMKHLHSGKPLPEIIFLDLYMPRMSGEECIRNIRAITAFDQISIVIHSTSYDRGLIESLFQLGANRFLQKPVSFRELVSSLSDVLKLARNSGVGSSPVYDLVDLPQ